jgi:hypothetical protein
MVGDFNSHYLLWDVHGRSSRGSSELVAYMLRWNMILHTPSGEITRHRHKQRSSTIDLAWATEGVVIRYCGDLGLVGSDHKAQLISVAIAAEGLKGHKPQAEGWNWPMMKNDIVQIEAE